ncbi:hypothetical protein JQ615_30165 [Bradyrhizobium jicamae]|uniref:Uncharacterized protein n=1 Tax=Bradyrhizobium jicamae TaxID=280332 RepID=A0ABS5FSD2_9BRAD|nr:hypothetical protein [Bradyrhizobium jicamae]MBR0799645.1 hypothetical protein [Bradyrhizobium jicamae]MBR0934302.1 hypothetical protein [Bradyrhizobium jicamae]
MIPRGAEAIGRLAQRITNDLIPKAPDAYTIADLGLITALLGMIAQDFDRAADLLVSQHEAVCPILREAAARMAGSDLASRIEATLAQAPTSLRISDLSARSDATLRLMIEAHAAVEVAADAGANWAKRLDEAIWRFLEAQTAAEAYQVAPLTTDQTSG